MIRNENTIYCVGQHSMKKREILSNHTEEIFREINSLVTYLVKSLLSRNFCQKCVRENSRNFHTVNSSKNGQKWAVRTKYFISSFEAVRGQKCNI